MTFPPSCRHTEFCLCATFLNQFHHLVTSPHGPHRQSIAFPAEHVAHRWPRNQIGSDDLLYPGYPKNPDALTVQDGFKGRQVVELDFSESQLKVCRLRAIDWFNNGSFYLLEAPGHTNNHVMALARMAEEKFVLFGGDTAREFRPTPLLPLPESILPSPFESPKSPAPPSSCLCSIFEPIYIYREHRAP